MTGALDLDRMAPAELARLEIAAADLVVSATRALADPARRRAHLGAVRAARAAGAAVALDLDLAPPDPAGRPELADWLRALFGPGTLAVLRPEAASLFPAFFDGPACLEGLLDLGAEAAVVAPPGGKVLAGTGDRVVRKGPTPAFLDQKGGARRAFFERLAQAWGASREVGRAVQKALAGSA